MAKQRGKNNGIKVLIVDDELEVCHLTERYLSRRGYQVAFATTPEDAAALVKSDKPQAVLLDVRLQDASGMDVLRHIKQVDSRIKVIMVTALNDEENIKQAASLGADDYIIKPFASVQLISILEKKLAGLKINPDRKSGANVGKAEF